MASSETNQANTKTTHSELIEQFKAMIERYILDNYRDADCYLGLSFQQGGRTMLQINVPASHLPYLLKAKPSDTDKNEPLSWKNRPLNINHSEQIKNYIISRTESDKKWILGTLTANVSKEKIEIVEFFNGFCLVIIPKGVSLDITDGQHRASAIQDLITGAERYLINKHSFPITLVIEDSDRQSQIDFCDMAQIFPISKSLLISYGALGRDEITIKLIKMVSMFHRKTELIKRSPNSRSTLIYTTNYIARIVSLAFTNESDDELLDYDIEKSAQVLGDCLNQFFSECLHTKSIADKEELTVEEVVSFKEICLLGVSVGLEILGRLLYCTYDKKSNSFDGEKVSQLAKLDWSRKSVFWKDNVVIVDPTPKDPAKPYKITFAASAVATAVKVVKERLGWI
jgi:DNA sulfur modification protein DndB